MQFLKISKYIFVTFLLVFTFSKLKYDYTYTMSVLSTTALTHVRVVVYYADTGSM